MSSQEIPLTITPEQAAHGVILPVSLPGGVTRLRIPSGCRDGQLVRVRVGGSELMVRLRVAPAQGAAAAAPDAGRTAPTQQGAGAGVPGPPTAATPAVSGQRPPKSGSTAGCLAVLAAVATVIIAAVALNGGDDDKGTASSSPTPTYSSWSPTPLPSYTSGTSTSAGTGTGTSTGSGSGSDPYPSAAATAAAPAPSPFDAGTCLNGQLPDSTTAQRVEDVDEVSCSASDAHYKVIQRFGFTSDLHSCDANSRTEYAFSYSYTLNGTPINQYVYCLIGLGSYARN
ncbi:hypothetical protein AB0M92_04535 [Streptomyces sp. NPDC051582]|uniref:LppU/SCO3897 family protein n=1 Tax=Streptomyces sp. NPDC051582 TaxID=3155167 RepID=UPI003449CFF5